jgi:FAD/FMN-containing dehydrogenase
VSGPGSPGAPPDPAHYAIAGVAPRAVARPATPEEAAEALRAAARDGLAVVPWGGGTRLSRAPAPGRYDVALDLTALDRLVAYEPADLTLTASCGATLAALRAAVAAHGQEVPLEAARAGNATLGGILAANASGPRRLRLGSPRDRILGARFALGDGTLARSGGRVVKNVAGYAVHRLLCGSRGGLGVLLEASLKLEPAPARRVALVFGTGPRALGDTARWAGLAALEPAALTVVGGLAHELPVDSPTDPFTVIVGLEDDEARVDQQAATLERMLGEPDARLEGEAVADLWQALADLEERGGGDPRPAWARLTFTGGASPATALAPLLDGTGTHAACVLHVPAGRLHVFPGAADAPGLAERLARAGLTLLETVGVTVPAPFLPPQVALLELRARIRAALDPAGTLGFGPAWEREA